jgi:cytochrome c oxidase cbb3-type subunit 3
LLKRLLLLLPLIACIPIAKAAPANSAQVNAGARLFARNCAACHGSDGMGGVGVPLALPSFIDSVDDNFLDTTIHHGRPGRVMPSFASLGDKNIRAIIAYMRTWTGHQPPSYSRAPIHGSISHGAKLFHSHCARCHGDHGQGGHGTGVTFSRPRNLPILAPALNNSGFLAAATDSMIKHTLMNGRTGTPMVSFLKAGLSEKDIDDVVAYVRSMQKSADAAKRPDPSKIPPLIIRTSSASFDQTVQNLKGAVEDANMKLIRVQYLDQGLVPPGKEDKKQVIVYSCGFHFLDNALKVDPRVGLFLPCRVTVVQRKGKVLLMAVNPKRLSALFNNNELDQLCDEMYKKYVTMLEDASF